MKSKKLITIIGTALLVAAIGTTAAFAAGAARNAPVSLAGEDSDTEKTLPAERPEKPGRSRTWDGLETGGEILAEMEEKMAEMQAKMEEMQTRLQESENKWNALTDTQKEEIYKLFEQRSSADKQIIDKYLELGLIDEETAAAMREALDEKSAEMRESGKMPMSAGLGIRTKLEEFGDAAGIDIDGLKEKFEGFTGFGKGGGAGHGRGGFFGEVPPEEDTAAGEAA